LPPRTPAACPSLLGRPFGCLCEFHESTATGESHTPRPRRPPQKPPALLSSFFLSRAQTSPPSSPCLTPSPSPFPALTHSFSRGLQRKSLALIKKMRSSKAKAAEAGEKPEPVRTHTRNAIIVPEMIGSTVGVYNGKTFNQVEVRPDMVGHYLGEFSITYKPIRHGKAGIGSTNSSRFIPLK
jgi:small subunit ribosomal protein S15e